MGSCREFHEIMRLLADRFYCLAVDLPGHGKTKTATEQDYTIAKTAVGIIHLLDRLGISRCDLIGYSMGGRLALYLALHFPNYFSRVVLESASPGLKTEAERSQRLESDIKLAQVLETQDLSEFLTRWYEQPLFAALKQHPRFPVLLRDRLQNQPSGLARSLRYMSTGNQPSLWQKLAQHSIPTLLLVGELDAKFIGINREMANLCRAARLQIVAQSGHAIHLENTSQFAATLEQFLSIDQ